jgi:MOSC domain-containing protein YiiM
MRTFDELESLYAAAAASNPEPRDAGTVRLVCVRKGKGVHETPTQVAVTVERGVEGDRWFTEAERKVGQQVTLMSARVAALIAGDDIPLHMAGDNFLIDLDLGEAAMPVGTRVHLGTALLEVTPDPHHGCRKFNTRYGVEALQWVNHRKHAARRLRGVNCRVVADGVVAVGDAVRVER